MFESPKRHHFQTFRIQGRQGWGVLAGEFNGRQLADTMRKLEPDLPILFTTGYSRNAIFHQGRLDADVNLLSKPYTQDELARKIRETMRRK